MQKEIVISGMGLVSSLGVDREDFWGGLEAGKSGVGEISLFPTDKFSVKLAAEVKGFDPKASLGPKGLRNIDKSALFLMVAAQSAIKESGWQIGDANSDLLGVSTGTAFAHLGPILEFDSQVLNDGLEFSNPAIFPSTVVNAASSQLAIRFNIQGFNVTISTGFTAGIDALNYAADAVSSGKAEAVFAGGVDVLNPAVFFGFYKLGYLAGIKGPALLCPFDRRRNGTLLGEGAAVFCVENLGSARKRRAPVLAKVKAVSGYFDGNKIGRVNPSGEGLEKTVRQVLDASGMSTQDIGYISASANSSPELDRAEARVLKNIFGGSLKKMPVSAIKSMLGETISAAGSLQIASVIGAFSRGKIPPTINYLQEDPECQLDCVPNQARHREVKTALVLACGPGGYNSACVLEKP